MRGTNSAVFVALALVAEMPQAQSHNLFSEYRWSVAVCDAPAGKAIASQYPGMLGDGMPLAIVGSTFTITFGNGDDAAVIWKRGTGGVSVQKAVTLSRGIGTVTFVNQHADEDSSMWLYSLFSNGYLLVSIHKIGGPDAETGAILRLNCKFGG